MIDRGREHECPWRRAQELVVAIELRARRAAADDPEVADSLFWAHAVEDEIHARVGAVGKPLVVAGAVEAFAGDADADEHLGRTPLVAPQAAAVTAGGVDLLPGRRGVGPRPVLGTAHLHHVRALRV